MSSIRIDNLTKDLERADSAEVRGGLWDYSNRLGRFGAHLEAVWNPPTIGNDGITIEDAANAWDDSSFYPGLRPLR